MTETAPVGSAPIEIVGPAIYLNWLAASNEPLIFTLEYPLYSDAHITGETEHGPYRFLHTVPTPVPGIVQPTMVLRSDWHWSHPSPDFQETDDERYHGGSPAEEIAALASLAMGVRFRAGDSTRQFVPGGDPKGSPRAWSMRSTPVLNISKSLHRWVLPRVAEGQHPVELLKPLNILPSISPSSAISLVRSARLYQDSLWLAESEPELSWILMVSALETGALCWRPQKEEPLLKLESAKPELFEYLSSLDNPTVANRVAEAFKDSFGVTRKFLDFVLTFRPPEPVERPKWGTIDWSNHSLKRILKKVYDYRSKALHAGKPFPAPMCEPPYRDASWPAPSERPMGHSSMGGGTWREEDIPLFLHTFEYITRETLLKWWNSLGMRGLKSS
jgi:hypothetical protein